MLGSLCEIINSDQTGFLPGRRIAANIRKLMDLISESKENEEDNIIISCDYMKCFDRIEIASVIKAMELYGFSEYLIKWVRVMYTEFQIKIQNAGHFSSPIFTSRGVHQGGPASNALFLTTAKLVAEMIRQDIHINSPWIKSVKQLLNQFTNDMDVSIKHDQTSYTRVLTHLEKFRESTGFTLSYEKTTVLRIGSLRKSNAKLYSQKELHWTNDSINVLGIEIGNEEENILLAKNYDPVLKKASEITSSWSNRSLNLVGKINVINTLIASLFVYKMMVLPRIPDYMVESLKSMINKFLWNGHRPKIPLHVLQLDRSEGGLQLVDITRKDTALKTTWVKIIWEGQYPHQIPHEILHKELREKIWMCNLCAKDVEKVCPTKNCFWKDILKAWCEYHYQDLNVSNQVIWLNSHIRVNDTPIYWKTPAQKKLLYVSDIVNDRGYISHEEAASKYSLTVMMLNSLKTAIPKDIVQWCMENEETSFTDHKFAQMIHLEKPSSMVYKQLSPHSAYVSQKEEQWNVELLEEVNLRHHLAKIKKITHVPKFQSFQYRFLLWAIITNIQLCRWKVVDSLLCMFYQDANESYEHLFWSCPKIKNVWQTVGELVEKFAGKPTVISYREVVLCEKQEQFSEYVLCSG